MAKPASSATTTDIDETLRPLIPAYDSPVDRDMCKSIYWNLIEMLEGKTRAGSSKSTTFLREFWQTTHCDSIGKDLKTHRSTIAKYIGSETMQRILENKESEKDEDKAGETVMHFHQRTCEQLHQALPLESWVYYQTLYRSERAVAAFTGVTLLNPLGAWLRGQYKLKTERAAKAAALALKQMKK
jgi:hypothetical protein